MWNLFDSFYGISIFTLSKLGIFPCDPCKFIFWFPWTFFLLRSRGANKKIWYDIIVKNAFLSSHKNVLLQCFSCKVKVFVKLQKKRTDLERIKILPLLSVWNVIIPFPLFCSGENLEPGIVTLNFLLFTFLSGSHPLDS